MSMSVTARSNCVRIFESKEVDAVCKLDRMHLERSKRKFSDAINNSFSHQAIMLNGSNGLEERLQIQAYRSYKKIRTNSRRNKDKVKASQTFVTIYKHGVVQPRILQDSLDLASSRCEELRYIEIPSSTLRLNTII